VLYERGYVEAITPHIYKADVWKISGHYENYRENMYFFEVDEGDGKTSEYGIKPMNCPGHLMIYGDTLKSYRDLPLRLFEFGTVYRHELSGVVHGLMRARSFTQDDAHIFCMPEQVHDEVMGMLDLVDYVVGVFGFEYSAEVSTFYGPKIDIKLKDAIGRTWQTATIQVDFNLPQRFGLTYRTADNTEAQPYMLHRTILGSMERFFGILIEHYAGAFPVWLAPVQASIIPISDRHVEASEALAKRLSSAGVRAEVVSDSEPMRVKIAKAQQSKVPYMLVVGDKEIETDTVGVRDRTQGDLGAMSVSEFADKVASQKP